MIKTLLIGSFEYTIEVSDKLSDSGVIDNDKVRIFIDAGLDDQVKRQTLWHEILHALMFQYGLAQADHDEKLIDNLAHGICQVLRDNKELGVAP